MLDEKDMDRMREVFVTRKECQDNNAEIENKFAKDLVRLAVIETKLSQITWILTAVGGGIITMLIKMFFGS